MVIFVLSMVVMKQTSLERPQITIIEEIAHQVFTPLQGGVNELRKYIDRVGEVFAQKDLLLLENKRLQEELKRLQIENQKLQEYKYETQRLRGLLGFRESQRDNLELIGAEVIARSPNLWYKTITINKGSSDGVYRNMVAITPQGLVGRVSTVTRDTSVILLITDREGAVGSIIQENRTPGILEGLGNSNLLRMNHIPYYSSIEAGNRVVTSRLSEVYPPGILIGKVQKVTVDPGGLLKTAIVVPAVDFDRMEEIFLIK